MSYGISGSMFNKIVKHEKPGTGFWPIISLKFGIRYLLENLQFGLKRVKKSINLSIDPSLYICYKKLI